MYHIPLAFHCIYEQSDEGENGKGEDGSEISGGVERVAIITWPLLCK